MARSAAEFGQALKLIDGCSKSLTKDSGLALNL
jgi:hypothetical protein